MESTSHSLNGRKFGRAMPEQTWATEICWAVSNLKKNREWNGPCDLWHMVPFFTG